MKTLRQVGVGQTVTVKRLHRGGPERVGRDITAKVTNGDACH